MVDEWENGLSDEYEQEETSELQRELALERMELILEQQPDLILTIYE